MIDDELKELLLPEIPKGIPVTFISAVAQQGLEELKDVIWKAMDRQDDTSAFEEEE